MFFDKLWVRIKGELLSLKEDDSVTEDLRTRAGRLLDHVQERVPVDDQIPAHARDKEMVGRKRRELAGIEEKWRELVEERDHQKDSHKDDRTLPPNPRKLG